MQDYKKTAGMLEWAANIAARRGDTVKADDFIRKSWNYLDAAASIDSASKHDELIYRVSHGIVFLATILAIYGITRCVSLYFFS
jgi:hypothetical protein